MPLYSEVSILVGEILNNRLSMHRHNCPENITDLVFLEIENDVNLMATYQDLLSSYSKLSINQTIGRYVRLHWNLQNLNRERRPKSSLIGSYKKHSN